MSDVLFNRDLWQPALEKYAVAAHLTVQLFDADGHVVIGPLHETPLFQLFSEHGYDPGILTECARQCLAQTRDRPAVIVSQVYGLTVIGTSLVLDGKTVGAAAAGYAFVDFSQLLDIQHMAHQAGIGFEQLWRVAREQKPVPRGRLVINAELLQVLGDSVLRENSRTRQYEQSLINLQHAESALRQSHDDLEQTVEQRTEALRELSSSLLHAQDDERRRLARELHDSLGQYLAYAKMSLDALMRPDATEKETHDFEELRNALDQCLSETRTLSYLLHPPTLDELGLRSAIRWYVEGFSQRSGIQVNLHLPEDIQRLPDTVELVLFRILQESLTNIHRHSGSPSVDVRLELNADKVMLRIKDYGRGMPPELLENFRSGKSSGVGLRGMRQRISELSGRFEIVSDENGTSIQASVPLSNSGSDSATKIGKAAEA